MAVRSAHALLLAAVLLAATGAHAQSVLNINYQVRCLRVVACNACSVTSHSVAPQTVCMVAQLTPGVACRPTGRYGAVAQHDAVRYELGPVRGWCGYLCRPHTVLFISQRPHSAAQQLRRRLWLERHLCVRFRTIFDVIPLLWDSHKLLTSGAGGCGMQAHLAHSTSTPCFRRAVRRTSTAPP